MKFSHHPAAPHTQLLALHSLLFSQFHILLAIKSKLFTTLPILSVWLLPNHFFNQCNPSVFFMRTLKSPSQPPCSYCMLDLRMLVIKHTHINSYINSSPLSCYM